MENLFDTLEKNSWRLMEIIRGYETSDAKLFHTLHKGGDIDDIKLKDIKTVVLVDYNGDVEIFESFEEYLNRILFVVQDLLDGSESLINTMEITNEVSFLQNVINNLHLL